MLIGRVLHEPGRACRQNRRALSNLSRTVGEDESSRRKRGDENELGERFPLRTLIQRQMRRPGAPRCLKEGDAMTIACELFMHEVLLRAAHRVMVHPSFELLA